MKLRNQPMNEWGKKGQVWWPILRHMHFRFPALSPGSTANRVSGNPGLLARHLPELVLIVVLALLGLTIAFRANGSPFGNAVTVPNITLAQPAPAPERDFGRNEAVTQAGLTRVNGGDTLIREASPSESAYESLYPSYVLQPDYLKGAYIIPSLIGVIFVAALILVIQSRGSKSAKDPR